MKKKQPLHDQKPAEPQADAHTTQTPEAETTPVSEEVSEAPTGATADAQQALARAQTALNESQEKYIRLYAEFDNFRRRTTQEKAAMRDIANEAMIRSFLPILDDFERALATAAADNTSAGALQEGIRLIYDKCKRWLEEVTVTSMEIGVGTDFDAELHEAIMQTPVEDKALQGKIIEVVEKGYHLKDRVLRVAKVIIGS
ncbi:MAG: nucleotide exchange factor GrpE [Bacteroidota bacterium]